MDLEDFNISSRNIIKEGNKNGRLVLLLKANVPKHSILIRNDNDYRLFVVRTTKNPSWNLIV